jgi:acetylornithine deacetylase/succinyl-diaminopimelate desuccinylase-like protein
MDEQLGDRAVELLTALLKIDTTNPPGRERPAAELLAGHLASAGVEPSVLESAPGRANVVARLKGSGERPPLLLTAHLDVVPADPSRWTHPPFAAEVHDGYLWGRGAIDMKNFAAMAVAVVERLAREKTPLRRDVIFAGVADEEAGCDYGSRWLVDTHPERVRAECALGEVGGFSLHLFGRTFYPIQVAQKGILWMKATARAEPGHGSMPDPRSAVAELSRAIARLSDEPLPWHPSEPTVRFLKALAAHLPGPVGALLPRLADPRVGRYLLRYAVRDPLQQRQFTALLSNTVSPTVLRAGSKINVIPGEATVELDGRTLPGSGPAELLRELRARLGPLVDVELLRSDDPVTSDPGHPLFAHLSRTITAHDPTGVAVPYIIPGFTDALAFAKLGTQFYGFAPVRFDPAHKIAFGRLYHGNDERIPVDGLRWGTTVLYDAVKGWCR